MVGDVKPLFKFFINYQLLTEDPDGWQELVLSIKLDKELKGIYETFEAGLTCYGQGHDLLKQAEESSGFCGSAVFEAHEYDPDSSQYKPSFVGIIFLKDCKFYEGENGQYVKFSVSDNGFFSRIFNNKNLKAKITAPYSKNNTPITAATYERVRFHSVQAGTYISMIAGGGSERNNTCFTVYEVLRYLIAFMTDDSVDFRSTTFGVGGKYEDYVLTCGFVARFAGTAGVTQEQFDTYFPEISFRDILVELNKEFNLGFKMGFDGRRAYIQIEDYNSLFTGNLINTFENVNEIERSKATEYLYNSVKVGSSIVLDEPLLVSGPAGTRWIWFKPETYFIAGTCNNDQELDLQNELFIIDSNYIQDLVDNGQTTASTSNDSDLILLQVESNGGGWFDTIKTNWVTGAATPLFYNELLNTNNKIRRHLGSVPSDIAAQLGVTNNRFAAQSPTQYDEAAANPGIFDPADFSIEISDPNSNYDPAGYFYLAPLAGVYTFSVEGRFSSFGGPQGCAPYFDVYLDVYANADVPGIDTPLYSQNISIYDGSPSVNCLNVPFLLQGTVNLAAGYKVACRIITYSGNWILAGTIFQCTASVDGGGVYQSYDNEDYAIYRDKFKAPLSRSTYQLLKDNLGDQSAFSVSRGKVRSGWSESIKYKPFKGEGDFIFLSSSRMNR